MTITTQMRQLFAPIIVVAVGGVILGISSMAHASGTSGSQYGCYSKWWNTASASYCTPATKSYDYSNEYKCTTGWYALPNPTPVAAGQTLSGFQHAECTISVYQAYTTPTAPYSG